LSFFFLLVISSIFPYVCCLFGGGKRAKIRDPGKNGTFDTAEEATKAYITAVREFCGAKAKKNFPPLEEEETNKNMSKGI
jgi:hypothetical protein